MEQICLLDTNVLIHHLRDGILEEMAARTVFAISVVTEAEMLRFSGLDADELGRIEVLLALCESVLINSAIARRAALLGRTRKIKLPDLFIAATAIEHDLVLITRNARDFRNIPGLQIRPNV